MQQHIGMTFFGDHHGTYRRMVPEFPFVDGDMHFGDSSLADDNWLVFAFTNFEPFATHVPRERRILVLNEPSPMNSCPAIYANQFGILIAPYTIEGFDGNWFPSHPGLPWFFGVRHGKGESLSFSDLVELSIPEKIPELSVVVSNKVFHDGHRVRLRFLDRLRERLGPRLHLFGRGIREIDDKADAVLPYAYHLSLENTVEPNYWTEKLSDAFLGYSYPLYVGCPNATDWFPAESFHALDLANFEDAAAEVERVLDEDIYSDHFPSICAARDAALFNETVFNVVQRAIRTHPSSQPRLTDPAEIVPVPRKNLMTRVKRECRRLFHRVTFR